MVQQILQLNFQLNVSRQEYENTAAQLVEQFAAVPGCLWKIWLMNESKNEAGGIYLFEDEEAVANFKMSELFKAVEKHPALSKLSVKQFDVLDEISKGTYAPLTRQSQVA